MKSLSLVAASATLLLSGANAVLDPAALLQYRQMPAVVAEGCYSSSSGLSLTKSWIYNTKAYCQSQCYPSFSVEATSNKQECWCGNELPPASSKVDDSFCNSPCAGYEDEMCGGGTSYWSVYLTGTSDSVSNADDSSSSSSSSSSSTSSSSSSSKTSASSTPKTTEATSTATPTPSLVTISGQTVYITPTVAAAATTSTASSAGSSGSGPNKAAIAAGVVVGVLAVAAIMGGLFLFMRNRKRKEVEEEHKKQAAISSFVNNGNPPGTSGGTSMADTRLEPSVMFSRRMSDGSIADNQDYSRRILKVTNL